jgi:hypothetical protein
MNPGGQVTGIPHIRIHGLPHTFGFQMAMAGIYPFAIMESLWRRTKQKSTQEVILITNTFLKQI